MTVHDWSRVDDNVFHDFHNSWVVHIKDALNSGLLPPEYYARCEQHYGKPIADLLALCDEGRPNESTNGSERQLGGGAVALAVADAPPRTRIHKVLQPVRRTRDRTVAVRRAEDGRIVAVIEVVSPGNKDGRVHTQAFVSKLTQTLNAGVHLVLLDLLPMNRASPDGLHVKIADDLGIPRTGDGEEDGVQPEDFPIALLSYESDLPDIGAYMEYLRVGDRIPHLPLFLAPGHYVNMPLGATYEATYEPLPRITKSLLVAPPP